MKNIKLISNVYELELKKNKEDKKEETKKKPTMKDIFYCGKIGKCGKTKKEGCKCK